MTGEQAIKDLKRKVFRELFLRTILNDTTLAFFGVAGGIFLCRLYDVSLWIPLLGLGLVLVGISIRAWYLAKRAVPQAQVLRALIDRHNGAGGLLMAAQEVGMGRWEVPSSQLPPISGVQGKDGLKPSLALLFMVLLMVVPARWFVQAVTSNMRSSLNLSNMESTIEVMEEAALIEEQLARDLFESLETIQKKNNLDAAAWEALDSLEEHLAEVQARKDASLATAQESLAALEQALEQVAKATDQSLREEAMDDLLNMAKEMGPNALQEAMADKGLSSQQGFEQNATDLAAALEKTKMSLKEKQDLLAALSKAKQATKKPAKSGNEQKKSKSQKLAEMIAEFESQKGGKCEGLSQCLLGGGAGTDDNGQSAELTWKDPKQHDAGQWDPIGLDHAGDGDESVVLRTYNMDPETDGEASARFDQRLNQGQGGGAHRHAVLPHHRKVVKRFFDGQR